MPITEEVMALGDWSLTLRPDTPATVRDRISIPFSSIVITNAWLDIENSGLDDDGILAAARYTGVGLRPGPQLTLGGQGLAWWLADADNQPWNLVAAGHTGATWSTAYSAMVSSRFNVGSIASGGSFTIADQRDISRRNRVDMIAQAAGHEWRINPDLSFDADTVANLYGTTPSVILVDAAPARGPGLIGLEATFTVEEDWEQWGDGLRISTPAGYTLASIIGYSSAPSNTPVGQDFSKGLRVDAPDVPQGFEQTVADAMFDELNQPRQQVAVHVTDPAFVDHVRCGDIVYVYDELQGLRDFDNQVEHGGRTIWPKVMRATRMSWPVRQGMGVYWRTWEDPDVAPYWTDLTPYVQWEDGDAQVDLIQGDASRYSLNPATGRVDQVGAAIERSFGQPWATYTPTWSASPTPPTLGTGTIEGSYRRRGTELHLGGSISWGGTTSGGSGAWTVSLPSGCTAARTRALAAFAYDANTATMHPVSCRVLAAGTTLQFGAASNGFFVDVDTPFTWASGDYLSWSGTIELSN